MHADTACGARLRRAPRSASLCGRRKTHRRIAAVASGRLLKWRRPCAQVCARRNRRPGSGKTGTARVDLADDRRFARFAGLAGLPAILPAFSKARGSACCPSSTRLSIIPSPSALRDNCSASPGASTANCTLCSPRAIGCTAACSHFSIIVDSTVSTRAVVSALYAHVPSNGSELVLFDVNRNVKSSLLLRPASGTALARILPRPPRIYKTTVISHAAPERSDAIRTVER